MKFAARVLCLLALASYVVVARDSDSEEFFTDSETDREDDDYDRSDYGSDGGDASYDDFSNAELCSACKLVIQNVQIGCAKNIRKHHSYDEKHEMATEAMEDVCKFKGYAASGSGASRKFMKFDGNFGGGVDNFSMGGQVDDDLNAICELLMEEHGDFFVDSISNAPLVYKAPIKRVCKDFCDRAISADM